MMTEMPQQAQRACTNDERVVVTLGQIFAHGVACAVHFRIDYTAFLFSRRTASVSSSPVSGALLTVARLLA